MSENPWDTIGIIDSAPDKPDSIVSEFFSPIKTRTNNKITHRLQRVNYFPEEVQTRFSVATSIPIATGLTVGGLVSRTEGHPEFGYDPKLSKQNSTFRYRLLFVVDNFEKKTEYELFKFKYGTLFYPVTIYCEKTDFSELAPYFPENDYPKASTAVELKSYLSLIIKSPSFKNLIQHLVSL